MVAPSPVLATALGEAAVIDPPETEAAAAAAAAAAAFAAFMLSNICRFWICFCGVESVCSCSMATLTAFSALSFDVVVVIEAETTGCWLIPADVVVTEVDETGVAVTEFAIIASGVAERDVMATIGFWALCWCTDVGIVETRI